MAKIRFVQALEILDSRGNPTVEVTVGSEEGLMASAAVPSGASTGEHEAIELRDGDPLRYSGKGVLKAVSHVNGPIAEVLVGQSVLDQERIDRLLCEADGTDNKGRLGANAILGASMAVARLGAQTAQLPLYRYLGGADAHLLPCPMMNIVNGGAHANNSLDFQEFMIRPIGAPTIAEAVRWGAQIFHTLKGILKKEGHVTAVGDEGGFAPNLRSNEEALDTILQAIEKAGFHPGDDVSLALDCAASEFYDKDSKRYIEKKKKQAGESFEERTAEEMVDYLGALCRKYPIDSIEDGLDENDWEGWTLMTERLKHLQIVGDDIFVTNPKFLRKGFEMHVANAILIKLNQIGTVSETLETIRLAHTHGYRAVVSHRSGETADTFIADLAVGANTGQIKTGSLSRTDRVAKYNRLLAIEAELGKDAQFGRST